MLVLVHNGVWYVMTDSDEKSVLEFVRRRSTFEAFEGESLTKQELATALGVSRPTAHRIISYFETLQIITRTDGRYVLTRYGTTVGEAVKQYHREVTAAATLTETLNALPSEMAFDHTLFTDATVTVATNEDPFPPVKRFIELLEEATTLKSFNTRFLEPLYVDRIQPQIPEMEMTLIYAPAVLTLVETQFPEFIERVTESDNRLMAVHDDLPLMMHIFDDRVGIGVYPESGGTPIRWVDTADPDAFSWAEDVFETYQTDATHYW